MNKFIALYYFLLSLFGCDIGGSTFVHRASIDGRDTLYSKVVAQPGVARFECLRSASGQCHYTVFPGTCSSAPIPAPGPATRSTSRRSGRCPSGPVERFAIANGDSRRIAALPRFRVCVSADSGTRGPDCELPEPLAAR